jgi:hypothetical protein
VNEFKDCACKILTPSTQALGHVRDALTTVCGVLWGAKVLHFLGVDVEMVAAARRNCGVGKNRLLSTLNSSI